MDDLVAFLNARLDEDEAAARLAAQVAGPDWSWKTEVPEGAGEPTDFVTGGSGALLADTLGGIEDMAPHIARYDPARVLREVEAKRAILAEHRPSSGRGNHDRCRVCSSGAGVRLALPCPTLRYLAAVYSDHPGYRAEWG